MTDRTQAMTETAETRTVHDPFFGKDVQVSDKLTDRLRGRYASGPHLPNGEPEFGWRQFQAPPIQHEAAAVIESLSISNASLKARIAELESNEKAYEEIIGKKTFQEVADRIREMEQVVGWVDSWVSNPVGAYSVHALDGLFRTTREKIEALRPTDTAP